MRALASLLAVGAVVAVAAAAVVDAVGRRPSTRPSLRGVSGELVYSDRSCHRHALRLPDLAGRDFHTLGCDVFSRSDNLGIRNGTVAWFAFPVPGGSTTLLSARDLPAGLRVTSVAWLGLNRFAALLEPRGNITLWQDGRQLAHVARGSFTELRPSPHGGYFAALGAGRILVIDRAGRPRWQTAGRAVAWSPGERYAAVARAGAVDIVAARSGGPVGRIPVGAVDLDWRMLGS